MDPNQQPQPQQPAQPQQPPVQPQQPVQPPQMTQAPAPDTNSSQQQPKVQYVVAQKSLEGISGWLAFFLVIFGLNSLGFFVSIFNGKEGLHIFTDPILALSFLACVILIALRKKIALWAIYGTIVITFLVNAITQITSSDNAEASNIAATIIGSLIGYGLISLYFFSSKRVKATLIQP